MKIRLTILLALCLVAPPAVAKSRGLPPAPPRAGVSADLDVSGPARKAWLSGLASWEAGRYAEAGSTFTRLWQTYGFDARDRARLAFWLARTAEQLDETVTAEGYYQLAAQEGRGTIYGRLGAYHLANGDDANGWGDAPKKKAKPVKYADDEVAPPKPRGTLMTPIANPSLVYAIIQQESAFNPKAKSRYGALGLMQIMPDTAMRFAKGMERKGLLQKLLDPDFNVAIGQRYIAHLATDPSVDGSLIKLLAAYNSGPRTLERDELEATTDPMLYIARLPASETRGFVENTLANNWAYRTSRAEETAELEALSNGEWPKLRLTRFVERDMRQASAD